MTSGLVKNAYIPSCTPLYGAAGRYTKLSTDWLCLATSLPGSFFFLTHSLGWGVEIPCEGGCLLHCAPLNGAVHSFTKFTVIFTSLNTVTMVRKSRTHQAPPYLCKLLHDRFCVSGRSTRNTSQLNLRKCSLSTGQRSFAFRGAKEYNLLPENIRILNNISSFKRKSPPTFLETLLK